ncbi:hypothetical protein AR1Y2_3026 [Anaerostipes rhamnosivorans]|jgi:hypothetical protein|uniref:Uncharacterized protein n=1 Tax=Anaerostipes rhamnosivorans TaxID=1229621 RepID=A0A4V1EGL3_9FIRM|nr:hypothetical protein AR1Y2_3026 [Anaerostipes rhamnosivorans]
MADRRRFQRKNRKSTIGWEKRKETLILSGKLTIIKRRNGEEAVDKH